MSSRSALKLWICLILCVSADVAVVPAADGPLDFYFPVLESGSQEFLGLSILNTSSSVNVVTIGWRSGDGSTFRAALVTLLPGTQSTSLLREFLLTADDPPDGWINLHASAPGLLAYLTSGTDTAMDGAEPISELGTTTLLEHVAVNTGFEELDHTDTFVALVNPGNRTAGASAELIGLDGRSAGTLALQVPASGSRTLRVSEAFRDVLPPNNVGGHAFAGYMKVVSDSPLAGWLRIETPLSRRVLRGRPIQEIEPSPLAVAAHFASGSSMLYRSALNLVNIADAPVQLELLARDDRGGRIGNVVSLVLGPGEGVRDDVMTLFQVAVPEMHPPPLVTGCVLIRAAGGSTFRLAGDVAISTEWNRAAMLYPISTAPSRNWIIPFALSGRGYFTGYALSNPNELLAVQTDVTVELLDSYGRPAAQDRTISLSPSARFSGLLDTEMQGGYLRIQASSPVFSLGSIGTASGSELAFLPAYPQ